MKTYHKLVRDGIPEIIRESGRVCRTRVLEEAEYRDQLNAKLREEGEEYFAAESREEAWEELADMLEVIRSLAEATGTTWVELERLRAQKAEQRGGFQERIFLIDVKEKSE